MQRLAGRQSGEYFLNGRRIVHVPVRAETRHVEFLRKAVGVIAQFGTVKVEELIERR